MKTLKNCVLLGAAMLLTSTLYTACDIEGNDWETDASHDRLFHISQSSLSVTPTATTAEVTFKKTPNTAYYVIQISRDSLYDEMDESAARIETFGEDRSIVSSPYVLENLYGDTKYYLRMKGCSGTTTQDSYWVYLKKSSFKTKAEQILNEIGDADRNENWIRISWAEGSAVTHLIVSSTETVDEETVETRDSLVLSADDIAAAAYTITGLKPMTSYTISIYNNTFCRGTRIVSTTAPAATGDYMMTYDAAAGTMQEQLDAIAAQAKSEGKEAYSVTVTIPGGTKALLRAEGDDDNDASVTLANGMSVTFFGGAGEVPTLLFLKPLNLAGSHGFVRFENLNVENGGGGYVVNQSESADVEELTFSNCYVSYFLGNTFLRVQGNGVTINTINLINSRFYKCGDAYGFIDLRKGIVKNIVVDGCTFQTISATGKCFIQSEGKSFDKIAISNSTFYNVCGNGQYFIDLKDKSYSVGTYEMTNVLFAKTADEVTNKNLRAANDPVVTNCYYNLEWFKTIKGAVATEMSCADMFVDPENGDFHFKPGVNDAFKVGDPRWLQETE